MKKKKEESHQPIDHLLFKESIKIKLNFLQNRNMIGISPYFIILYHYTYI